MTRLLLNIRHRRTRIVECLDRHGMGSRPVTLLAHQQLLHGVLSGFLLFLLRHLVPLVGYGPGHVTIGDTRPIGAVLDLCDIY